MKIRIYKPVARLQKLLETHGEPQMNIFKNRRIPRKSCHVDAYSAAQCVRTEPATSRSRVQCSNHHASQPLDSSCWTWIGSIHGLDWIVWVDCDTTFFSFYSLQHSWRCFFQIMILWAFNDPGFNGIKSQHLNSECHVVYEFDLTPANYRLDWIGSGKWTHVPLCCSRNQTAAKNDENRFERSQCN